MQAINNTGRKVGIPNTIWPDLEARGFTLPTYYREVNPQSSRILVTRWAYGLGDLVCAEPVIRGLRKAWPRYEINIHMMERYRGALPGGHFYLWDKTPPNPNDFCLVVDLYCPADQHESMHHYHPVKDRTTCFCEAAKVSLSAPKLKATNYPLAYRWATATLNSLPPGPAVGIQPHSAMPIKDWPHLPALMARLHKSGINMVVFGPRGNLPAPGTIFVQDTTVEQLICLAAQMDAILAPDSALLHIGGALGVPTVGLFGPTNGPLTTAWYPSAHVVHGRCSHSPCYFYQPNRIQGCFGETPGVGCMQSITVDEVFAALEDEL